jgi:Fur family ferric uptake transcriptional regulator
MQRDTKQRRLVDQAMAGFDDFRSARQLHEAILERGESIGLATVYRTLRSMFVAGQADSMVMPDGETVYRKCSQGHHHHLVCRTCGATIEIVGPVVERWSNNTAAEHGYDEVTHTLEIFGRCATCRADQESDA